jgi:AcrR family transcriptional regulator
MSASIRQFDPTVPHTLPDHDGVASGTPGKRERIMAGALKLFANESFQSVTMDRVAEAANVAKGTLYLYFPSKEALYLGILSDGLDAMDRIFEQTAHTYSDPRDQLRHAVTGVVDFYAKCDDLLRLFSMAEPRLAEARSKIIESARQRGWAYYASVIEEGKRRGIIADVNAKIASLAIAGGIRSVLLYYGPGSSSDDIGRELADMIVGALASGAVLRGPAI